MASITGSSFFTNPFFLQFAEGMGEGYQNQINLAITGLVINKDLLHGPVFMGFSINDLELDDFMLFSQRINQFSITIIKVANFMSKLDTSRQEPWRTVLISLACLWLSPILITCVSKIPNQTVKKVCRVVEKSLSIGCSTVSLISTLNLFTLGNIITPITGLAYLGLTYKIYKNKDALSPTCRKVIYCADVIFSVMISSLTNSGAITIAVGFKILPLIAYCSAYAVLATITVIAKTATKVRHFIETMKHDFHQKPDFD